MRCSTASSPTTGVNLVGHSLGGNVGGLYAGIRPQRVARFVNLEGFGMPATRPEQAPKRYARWMDELKTTPHWRPYASYAELADRMQKNNARLTRERAEFLARHWGREAEGGGVVLRSDPAHKLVNATLYRLDEAQACWAQVSAPVLWVDAEHSETMARMKLGAAELARAARGVQGPQVPHGEGRGPHAASRPAGRGGAADRGIPGLIKFAA